MMQIVRPDQIRPWIKIANYTEVRKHGLWGPRVVVDFEFVYVVAGHFAYRATDGKQSATIRPGQLLCIPPGEEHLLYRSDDSIYQGVISCIHFELLQDAVFLQGEYRPEPLPPLVTDLRGDEAFHALFKKMAAIYESAHLYRTPMLETVMKELWLRLAEYWITGKRGALSIRLERMLMFLQDHMTEPVSRQDLAKAFHLTPEHVNAIFRKELGETPTQYLHRLRVKEAYRLLVDGRFSVKETATQVGFESAFYFSRIFRRIMGFPPSEAISQI